MSKFQQGLDFDEEEFPLSWPNERRVKHINGLLADPTIRSIELLLRDGRIIVRVWFVDHMNQPRSARRKRRLLNGGT
jgi:hypothetical protein